MSRIAIISDVHANLSALNAVLQDAASEGIYSQFWFLGDLLGYGPHPLEVLRKMIRLIPRSKEAPPLGFISGNHDEAILGRIDWAGFDECALDRLRDHQERLSLIRHQHADLFAWYQQLKPYCLLPDAGAYMAHGQLLWQEDGTINMERAHSWATKNALHVHEQFSRIPVESRPQILLNGHTHQPWLARWSADENDALPMLDNDLFDPNGHRCSDLDRYPIYINPGTVGFPRYHVNPTYVILERNDDTTIHVWFKAVSYDKTKLIQDLHELRNTGVTISDTCMQALSQ